MRFKLCEIWTCLEVSFRAHDEHFVVKNTTFRAPPTVPKFTQYCACHQKWHLNFTKYCPCHEKWHLTFTSTAPATKSDTWALGLHQVLRRQGKVTLELHQVLRLPRWVTSDTWAAPSTARFVLVELDFAITWRFLLLDSTIIWRFLLLYYYLTIPFTWLYAITWRFLLLDDP